jgi:hypothetical protein
VSPDKGDKTGLKKTSIFNLCVWRTRANTHNYVVEGQPLSFYGNRALGLMLRI